MNRAFVASVLLLACRTPAAPAQPPPDPPTVIQLRPAPQPTPALKYRLVPERRSLIPGNAAVFYHRGIQILISHRQANVSPDRAQAKDAAPSAEEQIAQWISDPIAKIPREEARKRLEAVRTVLSEVELGAMRSTCDWEFDLRREGISLLLPEIQEMRSLARLVSLRAKLAILDGKTDEALHWIEVGLVMGRHVSQGPTVIQALVGVAIDSIMCRCLEELIQVPGTPSLYWALADRPRPFIDMRSPMEGERYLLEKELPALAELDGEPWSLEQARHFTGELQRKLYDLTSGSPGRGEKDVIVTTGRQLGIAAMAAKIYPAAKRALIAGGLTEAKVEAMPVVQVAALHTIREYQRLRDETYKWMSVPYWQSHQKINESYINSAGEQFTNPLLTLFRMLTPALNSARLAAVRLERQLDALQCVEAIRLYAAGHGNTLPANLDAITEAPVPLDPVTGKSFGYKVDGDTATLSAPFPPGGPDHPTYAIRYSLKLTR